MKVKTGMSTVRGVDRGHKLMVATFDSARPSEIADQFRSAGYCVQETQDTDLFFAALQTENFDAAIIDGLPVDFAGAEFSAKIATGRYFPRIFLAADGDEQMFDELLQAGAYACLVRPIEPLRLFFIVRAAIQHAQTLQLDRHSRTDGKIPDDDRSRSINVVTGLLMERFSLTQHDAFERLRQYSRSQRAKIGDIAQRILVASDNNNQLLSALTAGQDGGVENRGRTVAVSNQKKPAAYKPTA